MKEEVIEMYKDGISISDIADSTGLAPSTVGVYIYASKINKDPQAEEAQLRRRIRDLISEYEQEFGTFNFYPFNIK